MKPAKKTMGFKGCAMIATLLGTVMLGGGISLLNRWNTLGGGGKSAAIILVILGTLVLLPFVLMLGIKYFVKWWVGSMVKDFESATKDMMAAGAGDDMVAGNKALYETIHTFRAAEEEDFDEDVNPALYESAQRDFSALGFRHLGDVVDETIEQISDVSPPIRVMVSIDGTTTAGFYHFTPPEVPAKFGGKPLLMIDLASEFGDGTFLASGNTQGLDLTTAAPGIDRRQHPLETPIEELVRLHEAEKQKLLAAKSAAGSRAVVINTLSQALESEKRQQALKNKFRKQIGYIDPEEVRRIAKNVDDNPAFGDMAARAADEARKREQDER